MITALDIDRSAKLLIDRHGDEAPIHAAMRADELLDKGDLDGAAVWRRAVSAVNELLADRPAAATSAGAFGPVLRSPLGVKRRNTATSFWMTACREEADPGSLGCGFMSP